MQRKILSYILVLAICLLSAPHTSKMKSVYAAVNEELVMIEGETLTITIPKKQKYYTSSESNGCVSSKASYKSRKVKITALKAGTSTLTITSTKNKEYKYAITVNAKPADATAEKPQSVAGACPHCKRQGRLQTTPVTYTRNAIKTGYLKEPLISAREYRWLHFSDKLSEAEIQALVASWHGVILSKFSHNSQRSGFSNFAYDIVVPYEYSRLNNISVYQRRLAYTKGFISAYDVVDGFSAAYNADNYSHYLTEWTIEDVTVEPAKQITANTGVIECTYCGYKYIK